MKTIAKLLGIILIMSIVFSACAKKYTAEQNFEATPIDGGKAVEITGYVGTEWTINIPPKIQKLPVTHIAEGAFAEKNLINVTIPNGVISIGDAAFAGNQLTGVTIPNSVTSIGEGAFAVNKLTSITISNSVINIGEGAFFNNQLTSITIPKNVTEIGDGAFDGNNELTAINVSSGNANYSSKDGVLYNKDGTTLIRWPVKKSDAVTIPNTVTSIGTGAFIGNQLTSVTIPDSVTTIGGSAFRYNQLTSVTIGNNVTAIVGLAFADNQLTNVTIGNSVTEIGNFAFSDNQLTSIIIPDSVTSIGSYAFIENPLIRITIGANVTTTFPNYYIFGDSFDRFYHWTINKAAGTYTRPNADSRTWTRQ